MEYVLNALLIIYQDRHLCESPAHQHSHHGLLLFLTSQWTTPLIRRRCWVLAFTSLNWHIDCNSSTFWKQKLVSGVMTLARFSCNGICQWHHLEAKCERRRAARRRWAGESGVLKAWWGLNLLGSWVGPPASQSPSVYSVEEAALTPPSPQQLNSPLLPFPHISIITSFVFSCPSLHPHFFKNLLSSLLISFVMSSSFCQWLSLSTCQVSLSSVHVTLDCFTSSADILTTDVEF